jgi:polyisoprenoid-binding protein YceI
VSSTTAIADVAGSTGIINTWKIDPAHSAAEFTVRHMMISCVKGKFSRLAGTLRLDENDYTRSAVEVTIPAASVSTVDDKLDAHLKNADFFDVEKFPTLTFKSTVIRSTGNREFEVTGDLTIRGVAKSVILSVNDLSRPANDPLGNQRIGLSGSAKINRKDFGLAWNAPLEFGGMLVGDEVTIALDVQFIKG